MTTDIFLSIVAGTALGVAVSAHVLYVKLIRRVGRCEITCDYLRSRDVERILGPVVSEHYGRTDAHGRRRAPAGRITDAHGRTTDDDGRTAGIARTPNL